MSQLLFEKYTGSPFVETAFILTVGVKPEAGKSGSLGATTRGLRGPR